MLSTFTFLNQLEVYDIEAAVEGGVRVTSSMAHKYNTDDPSVPRASQAIAIRLATARGLRTFITAKEIEMMRRGW